MEAVGAIFSTGANLRFGFARAKAAMPAVATLATQAPVAAPVGQRDL